MVSCGGAAVKELELERFVKVIALEVELTADKGAGGAAVNKSREYLGQAIELNINDKQLCRPRAELQRGLGVVDHGLGVLGGGWDIKRYQPGVSGVVPVEVEGEAGLVNMRVGGAEP
ncbi:hypothetical protein C0989_003380 [Termitomyces sp. Mn162]|nr:hypothetical protein C0989_003380 [Termitomyces sp. Mn162]